MLLLAMMMVTALGIMAAQETVGLGTSKNFAILAGSSITNIGSTTVGGTAGGNIGLHPGADPYPETFPGQAGVTLSSGSTVHLYDAVAAQAKVDLVTAYNDAAGRLLAETISDNLAGKTLTAGVYKSESSIDLAVNGTLYLDGQNNPNSVFVFQAGSTLTTGTGSKVELINGAQPCHIFWQVGSSATLGVNSVFVGHILALTSITANNGAEVTGQLLARNGAVTLENNTIMNDLCLLTGSLEITKEVAGADGIALPPFKITVTGTGDNDDYSVTKTITSGQTLTWTGLAPGTYTVTEGDLGSEWTVTGEGDVEVIVGETATATITNAYLAEVEADLPGIYVAEEEAEMPSTAEIEAEMPRTMPRTNVTEVQAELPRTGGSELLLIITGIGITLTGGFFSITGKRKLNLNNDNIANRNLKE